MKPPRALWVPFDLGRPFGAANQPEFQTRVLLAALQLLERKDGQPILEDFPEQAPVLETDVQIPLTCPVNYFPDQDERPDSLGPILDELEQLKPWHEAYRRSRGKAASSVSGLELEQVIELLGELAAGNPAPEFKSELELREIIRLGCDDLRTWYSECMMGQPGRGTHKEIEEWFRTSTAAAHLIATAAQKLRSHNDRWISMLAERAMVPRIYQESLFSAAKTKEKDLS